MGTVKDVAKLLIVCSERDIAYFMQTKLRENVPADCPESWEILNFNFSHRRASDLEEEASRLIAENLSAAVFYSPLRIRNQVSGRFLSDTCLKLAETQPECLIIYYPEVPNLVPTELLTFGTDERQIDVRTNLDLPVIAQDMAALIKKVAMLPVISGLPADDRKELYNAVEAG